MLAVPSRYLPLRQRYDGVSKVLPVVDVMADTLPVKDSAKKVAAYLNQRWPNFVSVPEMSRELRMTDIRARVSELIRGRGTASRRNAAAGMSTTAIWRHHESS